MDDERIFADRKDAGRELGRLLEPEFRNMNALILAIPRGGVEVAVEVARMLKAELSVVVTKKLPHPDQPELAIGAAAEDGSIYLTAHGRSLHESVVDAIVEQQLAEIHSRIHRFRPYRLPPMHDRLVIIVDDGIATGATLIPAIKFVRKQDPKRIVVAAPVSGRRFVDEVASLADDIRVVVQPEEFFAVGQVYEDFHGLSDDEVTNLLKEYHEYRVQYS